MMATTHVFVGLLLAGAVATVAPQFAAVAAVAAIVGGLFPDLDVVANHRRTLHFPVYYWLPVALTGAVALVMPTATTVGLAVFFLAAAVHSLSDLLGGSHELEPWDGTVDRAVYSHYHGRWLGARRWVGYDGSPGDLALAGALAIPILFLFDGIVQPIVIGMLVVSIGYALLRRPIAASLERLLERVPRPDHGSGEGSSRPASDGRSRRRDSGDRVDRRNR